MAKGPRKCIHTSRGDDQTSCKVCLASGEQRRCSNQAKTRNRLKFAGVPQSGKPISATSRPKSTILWEHVEHILLLNKFFFRLLIRAFVAKLQPDKVVRWCPDGDFWRVFCILCFQQAACSRFQTCILNSH